MYYDEIAVAFTRMQTDCKDFISSLKQQGINMDSVIPPGYVIKKLELYYKKYALSISLKNPIKTLRQKCLNNQFIPRLE